MIEFPAIPEDNRILFFRRDRVEFGFLSHFYRTRPTKTAFRRLG
jgi:hypothetical protein